MQHGSVTAMKRGNSCFLPMLFYPKAPCQARRPDDEDTRPCHTNKKQLRRACNPPGERGRKKLRTFFLVKVDGLSSV